MNNLNFNERLLLSLYAEFYKKYYDYNNKQKKHNMLVRHLEMQYLIFLMLKMDIYFSYPSNYSFSWDGYGPYSKWLEEDLKKLDTKKKEIILFYKGYEDIRKSNSELNYYEQLHELFLRYFYVGQIERMEESFYLLKDDVNDEKSANLMASIIYAKENMMLSSNLDLKSILEYLNKYSKTEIDYSLAQKIWKYLGILGIIEIQYYQPIKNNEILIRKRVPSK